ncbi:MAG: thioredoxin family protein [Cyclobacteriaceae bacterium]|nr:thioredoxin family protein [Cyclobacteriaceae bacterium]
MKPQLALLALAASLTLAATNWNAESPPEEPVIHFTTESFTEALNRAKKENKVVFVDVYATWCGPCTLLKRTTFTDKELSEYFNTHFINIAVDGETSEGKKVMDSYQVRSYPTLLFLNPDGSVREAVIGYHTASQLLKAAKRI